MRKSLKIIIPIAVGLLIIAFCVWMRFGDGLLPQGPQLPDMADSVDAPADTDDPSEGEDIPIPPDGDEGNTEPEDNKPHDEPQEEPVPEEPETPEVPDEPEIPEEPEVPEIPEEPEKVTVEVEKITLNVCDVTLYVGDGVNVSATVHPADAEDKNIKWSSSNTAVATVDGGSIKGVGVGEATVTAKTSNGVSVTLEVTVTKPPVNVENITLTPGKIEMFVGESGKIFATVYPEDADDKTVTFASSDPKVATVDGTGLVKGVAEGSALITATASNGKQASVSVTVKAVQIAATSFEYYYSTLESSIQQRLYREIYQALKDCKKTLDGTYGLFTDALTEEIVKDIFYMVCLDHPELFHSDGSYYLWYTGDVLTSLEFSYIMSASQYEASIEYLNESLKPLMEDMRKVFTEGERALLAYNYVKSHFAYDNTLSPDSHNMYKAYLSGKAVCEGYSKLFGYILNLVGIPNMQVAGIAEGESHQWTMAMIEGKWYHFDPTWDDPVTTVSYVDQLLRLSYFGVSDELLFGSRTVYSSLPVPLAESLEVNYYIKNSLTVVDLSAETLKAVAKRAYELCGHIAFMCTTDIYKTILSDTSYLWIMVEEVDSSVEMINYTYNDDARVIEVVFNN